MYTERTNCSRLVFSRRNRRFCNEDIAILDKKIYKIVKKIISLVLRMVAAGHQMGVGWSQAMQLSQFVNATI